MPTRREGGFALAAYSWDDNLSFAELVDRNNYLRPVFMLKSALT